MVSDKKILKFPILIYMENTPHPLAAMFFWPIRIAWTFLVEGHQSIIEISQEVFDKKNFKVFYTDIYGK